MRTRLYRALTPFLVAAALLLCVGFSRWFPAESSPRNDAPNDADQVLRERSQRARVRVTYKVVAIRELVEGRSSLAETAEQMVGFLDPVCEARLRLVFPAETVEESAALQLIDNIRSIPMSEEQADEVLCRLESELADMREMNRSSNGGGDSGD